MRTPILKRAWQAFRLAHFIPQSRGAIVMVALLLATANLPANPTVTWVSGGPNPGESGVSKQGAGYVDGDISLEAEYHTPCGLALDSSGDFLLVADRDNNTVRVLQFDINTTGTLLTYTNHSQYPTTNLFSQPVGVAIDDLYNIFVLNRGKGTNGTVLEFDYTGELIATNISRLTNAAGIALDANDNIYVTASNRVFRVSSLGVSNVVATITAPGASLQGIVVKHNGLLAVCDAGRNGILLINPNTGIVTTNAGFHGAGDFINTGNYSYSNTAKFFQPVGVAEAGDGTLIVTDYGNHRVKAVLASGMVTNLYGVSSNYWSGSFRGLSGGNADTDNGNIEIVQLPDSKVPNADARMPFGVVMAPDGSFYTTEDYYHIIRHVTGTGLLPPLVPPLLPAGLTAMAGYGQVILTWSASFGATNYNIKRSLTSGGPYTNSTIASTASTTYTDTNITDGTTYYYVVSASNPGGESANSSEASATPLYSPAPNILSVTTNYGVVSLTWSMSAGATSYNVKRSTSTGAETTIANTTGTSYNDTTVINGRKYYYVVTALNPGGESANSLEISATPPLPQIPDPQIGYVGFPPAAFTSVFHPVASYDFYNDAFIVIKGTPGSGTYYTFGYTNDASAVPNPSTNSPGQVSSDYQDGLSPNVVSSTYAILGPAPYLTIKAIGANSDGSPSSGIVQTEFQFITGNPNISGANAAQFTISDITANAHLYYTLDGSDPSSTNPAVTDLGISTSNLWTVSFSIQTNTLFKVIALRDDYQPSAIVSNIFNITSFQPNTISFGFAAGEASSDFVASPGQVFYAPVTLTTLSSTIIYSLQFNITVTNLGPVPIPGFFGFTSMLEKPDPANPGFFLTIPTWAFVSSGTNPPPNNDIDYLQYQGDWYQNLQFADGNLLGVGWVERYGATNLYITKSQELITYSRAHDVLYPNISYPNEVELGGYALLIPPNATSNDVYQIQIGRPSATSDGVGAPGSAVYISAPTNGSTAGGSPINALKKITMGQLKYIVGSVYPFRWFNAGDFGSSNIINADVEQVFEAAAYGLNYPLYESDFYDAMDSCGNYGVLDSDPGDVNYGYYTNVATFPTLFHYLITNTAITYNTNNVPVSTNITPVNVWEPLFLTTWYIDEISTIAYIQPSMAIPPTYGTNFVFVTNRVEFPTLPASLNTLFEGDDTAINQIVFGDGVLDVCDVYVTFRRSLDSNLTWFRRFWNNGQRVADTGAPNVAASQASKASSPGTQAKAQDGSAARSGATTLPQVNFAAGDFTSQPRGRRSGGSAGQTVQIPINAAIFGNYPLRVLMLNLAVVPLDGSPTLTTPVSYSANPALGEPYITTNSVANYGAAWLDSGITGLSNNASIGYLYVTIPANATSRSAYAIHFDHASASPNGLASFPKQTRTGLITLSSRTNSSYGDGIPDSWRLRWFGTVNNILSVSNACPSGDGINNWQKYVAGVDPNLPNNFPSLNPIAPVPTGANAAIHWPTVSGKQYVILRSSSLFPGSWSAIATNTGTGTDMEFDDTTASQTRFYRVQILP